jgi:hypothetical protein
MLNKETLVKIAIALLVIAIVWFILKARKKHGKRKNRKVIVTPMPIVEKYEDADDDDATQEEGFATWEEDDTQEDYEEMSPVEFRSELLE